MLYSVLVALDVLLAIGIIGLILIQHGKGADVGAAFGSGASGTVFGSRGSGSFMTRLTAILVTGFFINSLVLAYLASNLPTAESVIQDTETTIEQELEQDVSPEFTQDQKEEMQEGASDIEDISGSVEEELSDVPTAETIEHSATEMKDKVIENREEITQDLPLDDVPE